MDNLDFNDYTVGGDYDTWGDKIIADYAKIGSAFGDTYTNTATGGTVALSQSQSNCAFHRFTGTLVSNLIVEVLAGIGREWTVINATTGAFTLTYRVVGGGGAAVTVTRGRQAKVRSDGTDCTIFDLSTMGGTLPNGSVPFGALASVSDDGALTDASHTDVVTEFAVKTYADTKLSKSGGTMTGNIAMGAQKVTGLGAPSADTDASTKKYADDGLALRLALAGGTMSGNIAMGSNRITGLPSPTASDQAATRGYVDATAFSTALPGQAGNAGKFVTTDGTNASWTTIVIPVVTFTSVRPSVATTTNLTATAGQRIKAKSASGAISITLPATPAAGDTVNVRRTGANNVTCLRNGQTIAGLASDFVLDLDNVGVELEFVDSDWQVRPWSAA